MTSRATGTRPLKPKRPWDPGKTIEGREFPDADRYGNRKAVCRRCHLVMGDIEPFSRNGEFWHGAKPYQKRALACPNNGKTFDQRHAEIEPFLRKKRRRALKRAGVRA